MLFSFVYQEIWAGSTEGKLRSASAGRGILLARYYNMRRKLLKSGVIRKSSINQKDPVSEVSEGK